MSATDQSLSELRAKVILELKSISGSAIYTDELINNKLNEGYMAIYNQPKRNVYLREGNVTFMSIPDTTLAATMTSGDVTITVTSTTGYPTAGTLLIGNNYITYTGTTATTFTGCSGVTTTRSDAPPVRFCYILSTYAPLMDEQQIRFLNMNDVPLYYEAPDYYILSYQTVYNSYTIFNGKLVLPNHTVSERVYLEYFKALIPMASDADKPTLVPNIFRQMLVYYATGTILILDSKRTGWELYYNYNAGRPSNSSGLYFEWLKNFYAKYGRRIDQDKKFAKSIWD